MDIIRDLSKIVGKSRVTIADSVVREFSRDFAKYDMGKARAVVQPVTEEQVVQLVRWARKTKIPLVPVGSRSSFWGATKVGGRVAVDMRGMNRVLSIDETEGIVRAQAGIQISELDAILRRRGFYLPMCPDGFGDPVLASMIANDTIAGLGMFNAPGSALFVTMNAVLGTGEVFRFPGSSHVIGLPDYARDGFPDMSSVFFASEGAFGIITEMSMRFAGIPVTRTCVLSFPPGLDGFRRILDVGMSLRGQPICTYWRNHSWISMQADTVEIEVAGRPEEVGVKVRRLQKACRDGGLQEPQVLLEEPPRWEERPRDSEHWMGVSMHVPFTHAERIYSLWLDRFRGRMSAIAQPDGFLRWYIGAGGMAALFAWNYTPGDAQMAASIALADEIRETVSEFAFPYRIGTVWRPNLEGRLDPLYCRIIKELKDMFDPDNILNPGVGIFDLAPAGAVAGRALRGRRKPTPLPRPR
ncbi:MAG: FAD-binding oxidoreductase, partial [Elusimicrobiota bacterium]